MNCPVSKPEIAEKMAFVNWIPDSIRVEPFWPLPTAAMLNMRKIQSRFLHRLTSTNLLSILGVICLSCNRRSNLQYIDELVGRVALARTREKICYADWAGRPDPSFGVLPAEAVELWSILRVRQPHRVTLSWFGYMAAFADTFKHD
jgi:hypothetical protein